MSTQHPLPLSKIKPGSYVTIVTIPGGNYKAQFIRFGIIEGEKIFCMTRLPGGTLIIQKNRQEIAIGPALSAKIFVRVSSMLQAGANQKDTR
jgi:Fe2+ transport system protein FeoA